MQHHELKLDSNKANLTVEGHRLDNLPVPSMPWRPCTNLCYFLLNIYYRQIKSTQLYFFAVKFSQFGRFQNGLPANNLFGLF